MMLPQYLWVAASSRSILTCVTLAETTMEERQMLKTAIHASSMAVLTVHLQLMAVLHASMEDPKLEQVTTPLNVLLILMDVFDLTRTITLYVVFVNSDLLFSLNQEDVKRVMTSTMRIA